MSAPISNARLVEIVRSLLPTPVHQEYQSLGLVLSGGRPGLVSVRFDRDSLHVEVFRVRWQGHTPLRCPEPFATMPLNELLQTEEGLAERLETAIRGAINIRLERFCTCKLCENVTPPEWMHNQAICQSCAERHFGVVY